MVLCLLAAFVGICGIDELPLDSHEVLVAQTTREMSLRGDWVLPYFNGEPRLNKPPMSYWLTGMVAALAGDLPVVEPWHARAVSVAAGIVIVLATVWLGTIVFDRATGLVAGALVTASAGLFSFMHDARPDLLYACFEMLAITTGMHAFRQSRPPLVGTLGAMWICHAAAVLTKGPQIPALVILGTASWLRCSRGSLRAASAALRPLAGLAIVLVLCAPWWLAIAGRLGVAAIESSQLGGTLLVPRASRLGDPYYFYRPLQLLLPWLPLVLGAGLLALRQRAGRELAPLCWPLLATLVGLSVGGQYRYFYPLPLIGVMAVLVARPLLRACAERDDRVTQLCTDVALKLQAVVIAGAVGWIAWQAAATDTLSVAIPSLTLGAVAGALVWRLWPRYFAPAGTAVAALAVGFALAWPAATATREPWSEERYASHALAQTLRTLPARIPRATLGVSPTLFVYYSPGIVHGLEAAMELETLLARSPTGGVALVVRSTRLVELDDSLATTELARARRGGAEDLLVLVHRGRTGGASAP